MTGRSGTAGRRALPAWLALAACLAMPAAWQPSSRAQGTPPGPEDARPRTPAGAPHPHQPGMDSPFFTEEREAAALVFLRRNEPRVLSMLEELKTRSRHEYERAVVGFFRTSEQLAAVRQRDPEHYEWAIKAWRAEMEVSLTAARLVRHPENAAQIQEELRKAVEKQVQSRIEQAVFQARRLEAQLEQARRQREHLEQHRGQLVQERLAATLKAIEKQRSAPGPGKADGPPQR